MATYLALDANGAVVRSLQNPPLSLNTVSTAVRHGDAIYLSTLEGRGVLRYRLP